MTHEELNKAINMNEIGHIQFFAGEERELKKNFIRLITNKLQAVVYTYEEYDLNNVLRLLMGKGILGQKVLVVIDNEKFGNDLEHLSNKALKNYLVVICNEAPKTALKTQITAFTKLNRNELIQFAIINVNITKPLAEILCVVSEDDLCTLKNNINKLRNYTTGKVTEEMIETVCYIPDAYKIFDMIDAIANKQADKALYIYHKMKENNVAILSLMYGQYKKILLTKCSIQDGKSIDEIAQIFSIPRFVVNNCVKMSSLYTEAFLVKLLKKMFEIDCKIKTGRCSDTMTYTLILSIL